MRKILLLVVLLTSCSKHELVLIDGQALGTSSLMFSDLFLASGSVVNFNNCDVTLTHASNNLILDGGSLDLDGESLILDADGDTKIAESSDDVIHLSLIHI